MINENWDKEVYLFLELAAKHDVRMVMVGGGAVNFHGYQRHSADVDFWLDLSEENLQKLKNVLSEMGFENQEFPDTILRNYIYKKEDANLYIIIKPFAMTCQDFIIFVSKNKLGVIILLLSLLFYYFIIIYKCLTLVI